MKVALHEVAKGRAGRALPPTTLTYRTGRATLAVAETEQRPTVLGLLASGRMRPDAGRVEVDGRADAAALRRAVALVDALDVSEPEPNVAVAGVVAEELMFAGAAPNPFAARRWLDGLGLGELAGVPIGQVEPTARLRILLELAALRPGVRGIVLASPDRHGGEPAVWWHLAEEFADRGFAVLVIAGVASRTALLAQGLSPEPIPEPAPADPRITALPPNPHPADAAAVGNGRRDGDSAEEPGALPAPDAAPTPTPEPAPADPRITALPPNPHPADAAAVGNGRRDGDSADHASEANPAPEEDAR